MGNLVIWSDEILKELREEEDLPVFIKIGVDVFPVSGVEDSQSIGWYEIRYSPLEFGLISHVTSKYLLTYLPKGEMIMIQEGGHLGKSYPVNSVFQTFDGRIILKCDDPDSEYWAELEKWKIEQDNIKINITNFLRDELERRKDQSEIELKSQILTESGVGEKLAKEIYKRSEVWDYLKVNYGLLIRATLPEIFYYQPLNQ